MLDLNTRRRDIAPAEYDLLEALLSKRSWTLYCSDFARMIELLAMVDYKYTHWDYVHQICTSTGIEGGVLKVDDDIKDDLDDGTTWAEGWLKHPKLDHLVICHAVHDTCTHKHYSIPDLLRMNTFEVSVEMKI